MFALRCFWGVGLFLSFFFSAISLRGLAIISHVAFNIGLGSAVLEVDGRVMHDVSCR